MGTDYLQGDVKRRIKGLRKGAARSGPARVIRQEGAAQVALVGPSNSGKSSLHVRPTGSGALAGPYRFTTQYPEPGMLLHQDIHFQLVDLVLGALQADIRDFNVLPEAEPAGRSGALAT